MFILLLILDPQPNILYRFRYQLSCFSSKLNIELAVYLDCSNNAFWHFVWTIKKKIKNTKTKYEEQNIMVITSNNLSWHHAIVCFSVFFCQLLSHPIYVCCPFAESQTKMYMCNCKKNKIGLGFIKWSVVVVLNIFLCCNLVRKFWLQSWQDLSFVKWSDVLICTHKSHNFCPPPQFPH